jgi:broad specificity phosphatase PhoE
MQNLYVVSHPHAEHTRRDLVGGWHDSHLTPSGRRDAHLVAQELQRRRDPLRPIRITTSDLARCAETATIFTTTLDAAAGRITGSRAGKSPRPITTGSITAAPFWAPRHGAKSPPGSAPAHEN